MMLGWKYSSVVEDLELHNGFAGPIPSKTRKKGMIREGKGKERERELFYVIEHQVHEFLIIRGNIFFNCKYLIERRLNLPLSIRFFFMLS
jgi:hypothetical protein